MTAVYDVLTDALGAPVVGARVTVNLRGGPVVYVASQDRAVVRDASATTDATGRWTLDLLPNSAITPPGSHYEIAARMPGVSVQPYRIVVPPAEGPDPLWVYDLLVEPVPARQPPLPVGYQTPAGFLTGGLYVGPEPPPEPLRRDGTVWVQTTTTL